MRLQFIVGIGFDAMGKPITEAETHRNIELAKRLIVDAYGGVTVTRGEGSWRSGTGDIVTEPCVIFDVVTTWEEERYVTAKHLRELFRQNTIVLSVIESVNHFVGVDS